MKRLEFLAAAFLGELTTPAPGAIKRGRRRTNESNGGRVTHVGVVAEGSGRQAPTRPGDAFLDSANVERSPRRPSPVGLNLAGTLDSTRIGFGTLPFSPFPSQL